MAGFASKRHFLYIDFRWRGVRCREATKLRDTPSNRASVGRLVKRIDGEIVAGTFDYLVRFPTGPKRALFAPPPPPVENRPLSFDVWAREWIGKRESRLDPGTYYDRKRMIEGPLIDFFGARLVSSIDGEDIEGLITALKKRPGAKKALPGQERPRLSNRRVNMIVGVLRLCLDPVVRKGWLRSNPAREGKPLREAKTKIDPLSFDEVKLFLWKGLLDEEERRYFRTAFFSGLRPSEQIGLQWPFVDWHAKVMGINSRVTKRGGEGAPKNESSNRDVQMMPFVETALRAQRPVSELRSKYVFPNTLGGPLDSTNLRERVWKPALRRAGIRYRTMYQTRHTFATLALASGEDPGWVAKQMGHTTEEMIFRRYRKFIPNLTRRDGSALGGLMKKQGL